MIYVPMVRSAQTVLLSCIDTNIVSKQTRNEIPHDPPHLGVPSGASKMISEPMVRSAQNMHLLASRLALSPNLPNQASTWASSPRSTSGASKTIYEHMVHSAQTVLLSCTDTNIVCKHTKMRLHITHVTYGFHRVCPKWFLSLRYIWHKSCIYLAPTLTLSPNGSKWGSTWPVSPRSSIRWIQNDFWAPGSYGTNFAPILHKD
jgi:hypothetical protein